MSKIFGAGIVVGLLLFFSLYIQDFAYILGIAFGFIASAFNLFSYVGVSCQAISTINSLLISFGVFFLVVKVYKSFRD